MKQSRVANERIIDLVVSGSVSGSFFDYGFIQKMDKTLQKQLQTTTNLLETISRYAMGDLLFNAVQVSGDSSYVGKGDLFAFIEGRGRTKPDGLPTSTLRLVVRAKMRSPELMLARQSIQLRDSRREENLCYEGQGTLSTSGESAVAFERAPYIGNVLFDVSGDTRIAFVPTGMAKVWLLSMSITSKELLQRSWIWCPLRHGQPGREKNTITALLPTLYSLLWIMVRLLPTQSIPSRFSLSPMIRLKVVRIRELSIL